jgi:aspartyl-tRNA(Asn)/glutamyl-tRNA(Gln) amidotransferase subunit B
MSAYVPTIGIECHVQLKTKTKLFAPVDNDARNKAPNTTVSEICFGLPGTLPVLNKEAITLAIRAGLALNCEINPLSRFERKHYFYPDLPKGYQTTQLAEPIILAGKIETTLPDGTSKEVRIHHAHLEEDAGKLTHPTGADYSLVDLNRAGTPLIEIVSEADMHSAAEARAYATELYQRMTYADVTFGDLYHGNMRFDVNVSVAKEGEPWGTRTETKNLNSFRSIERAAEYEIKRQIELLEKGQAITQETRGWNEAKQQTFSQRSKEDAHDYRYFPDADIPPVLVSDAQIAAERNVMPKLPAEFMKEWDTLRVDTSVKRSLLAKKPFAVLVSSVQKAAGDDAAVRVANWSASSLNEEEGEISPQADVAEFVELAVMAQEGTIHSGAAKELFNILVSNQVSVRHEAETRGLVQSNDQGEIEKIVAEVIADPASQKAIADIRSGNEKAIGFLVGQVMKRSGGKVNPSLAQDAIKKQL